uniref:Uncharacterized protein n=1 Tax=Panagrolaimus sp. ES5 TaxID=591445 RepID=A0AC34G8Y8_9BILA
MPKPSTIRSSNEKSSPSPEPTKLSGPIPHNPIADQVSEKDFQDLQRPKDFPIDPDAVINYLKNEASTDELLLKNQKKRKRFIPRHIPDGGGSIEDITVNNDEDENSVGDKNIDENGNENMDNDEDENVDDGENDVPYVEGTVNVENIRKMWAKQIANKTLNQGKSQFLRARPPSKKRRINAPLSLSNPITPPSLLNIKVIEVQIYMDKMIRERERQAAKAKEEAEAWFQALENEKRSKRSKEKEKKLQKCAVFVNEYIDPSQMVLAKDGNKKWTFLSCTDRNKLAANPRTGIMLHPYRLPGKPEPFSKESARYCFKYVDTKPPYTEKEKTFWKNLNMGPPPHDFHQKEINGKPKKPAPTKEYFRRILGGRPRSHSCTTYTENERIYVEKNRLDKRKVPRAKNADYIPCSRNKLFIKYMMRNFTIPNINMEAQLIFSFIRKYDTGKYFQIFCVFWPEYHKMVQTRCRLFGEPFETPTIYNVIPYEHKQLTKSETAKIAPAKINAQPWMNDCADKLLKLFNYDEKPVVSVIQPHHEQLTEHPLIVSSAKSKLKQIVYEQLSLKQLFLNFLSVGVTARPTWQPRMDALIQTRLVEKRLFGIEGINDFLPQQFLAKNVSQIPEDHRIFLSDQNAWLIERMNEIREDEEGKRKKDEEKLRKVAMKKATVASDEARRKKNGLPPLKAASPPPKKCRKKPAAKKRKSKGGKPLEEINEPPVVQKVELPLKERKRKHSEESDDDDANDEYIQITAISSSQSNDHDFSPELTASYFSQCDTSFADQSLVSEFSASKNTTIPNEIDATCTMESEEEISKEMSLKRDDSSAEATFIYSVKQRIVCDPLITKAASKKKVFFEATFKAPKLKERAKFTVSIKPKEKKKARIVVSSKTKTVDFEFINSELKGAKTKSIPIPLNVQAAVKISEPSIKNVDANIHLIADCITEKAPEQLPIDIMKQKEKIFFTIEACKKPVADVEMVEAETVKSAVEVNSVLENISEEESCSMEVQQPAVKTFDVNEVYEQIMTPRDILKRSLSIEIFPKLDVLNNERATSMSKDYKFGTHLNSLQPIIVEEENVTDFDNIQHDDVSIADKETDKSEQMLETDSIILHKNSGENEALIHESNNASTSSVNCNAIEDISQPLSSKEKDILNNLEGESLLKESVTNDEIHDAITNTLEFTTEADANPIDEVSIRPTSEERITSKPTKIQLFKDFPSAEAQEVYYSSKNKKKSAIHTNSEAQHLNLPKVVDQCEPIQESSIKTSTSAKEIPKNLPTNRERKIGKNSLPPESSLEIPLTFEFLMKISINHEGNKIRAYTEYMSFEDALTGNKTFQIQQILNQKSSPYYAFKVGQNIIVNCGKVGNNENFCQAVISNNGKECKIYELIDNVWVFQKQLTANNVLLFDKPFGTRRSHIGTKCLPRPNADTEREIVVYKHDFGEWLESDGRTITIFCYYTVMGGKLILLYEKDQRYLFNLLWAPYLYYFIFTTADNHIFKEVILEDYNLMLDTANPPTPLSLDDLPEDNMFYIPRERSKLIEIRKSRGQQISQSSSASRGSASTSDKNRSTSQGTTPASAASSSAASSSVASSSVASSSGASCSAAASRPSGSSSNEKERKNDRKRNHAEELCHESIKHLKISPHPRDDCSFDSNDPTLVLQYEKFITEPLKYHQRLMVGYQHAFLMKEHQKLISHYAKIFVDKIKRYSTVHKINTETLGDFPSLMIKLGTAMLFTEDGDVYAMEPVDEKSEDIFRTFMGNIVAVSLCHALRILSCLFKITSPDALSKVIIDFHTGDRFKLASSKIIYCKPEPDWRLLDNALALSIFEYSKDSSTMTFFFIRHLINALKYSVFLKQPDIAYTKYYACVINFQSPFYFAERILNDTMEKFYDYISKKIFNLPEFPPPHMAESLIPTFKKDTKLSRSISIHKNTFNFKYEYNLNVFKLNTVIPRELFYPKELSVIPLEIQCYDSEGNDYFLDPVIPKWIFIINNHIIIHPATYRVLYHTFKCGEVYLFPFDETRIPFIYKFTRSNGRLDFYALLKSGMPLMVTDICTQPYIHAARSPYDQTYLIGVEEARGWIKEPNLLDIDYKSGLLHLTWNTVCTILRARHEIGLLSSEDSTFQTLSNDTMRRFRLHEFEMKTKLKVYIPNPPAVKRANFIPIPDAPYKK